MKEENKKLLNLIDQVVEGQICEESELKREINKHNNYVRGLETKEIFNKIEEWDTSGDLWLDIIKFISSPTKTSTEDKDGN